MRHKENIIGIFFMRERERERKRERITVEIP